MYQRDFTAQLLDVTPSNIYKDQLIQFHLDARSAHYSQCTPDHAFPFREIRLGGTLVDWTDTVS